MTKENLVKQLEEANARNQKLLLTLIQIKTSPSWDGKQIREHVKKVLTETLFED